MKKWMRFALCALAAVLLLAVSAQVIAEASEADLTAAVLPGAASLKKQSLKSKYKTYEGLGVPNEVLAVWKASNGYIFKTRVHYGAEFYEDPVMDVFVGMDKEGVITGVAIGDTVDHTAGFLGMVTQDYLDRTYIGQTASFTLTVDAVTGATFSSDAVLYGVQTAAYYAANVFRIGEREAQDIQIKKLQAVVPGTYEKEEVDPSFACEYGVVQYAARGTDEQGVSFHALVVQAVFTPQDPANNMAMPVYQIWIGDADGAVFQARMLAGHFYEAFPMDEQKLLAYRGIPLKTGTEYDAFEGGLITDAEEYILTSATMAFPDTLTGATAAGNDTSLSVRNCFITAARYYVQIIAK